MNAIASTAGAVCAAMILIGALHLIAPDGVMQKPVKYVLSVAFLVSLLSACIPAFRSVSTELHFPAVSSADSGSLEISNAEYVYSALLTGAGIDFTKITVCTDKTEDGGISISKVMIYTNCEEATVKSALGAIAENYEVVICHE